MTQHSDDDDVVEHGKKAGEGWVVTFADMMSLLMSFFVLLLSFSEQDSAKFKEVGGSLEQAFGVQRDIVAYQMPKGTSIVAKEFSPGKPRPTAVNEVRQSSIDDMEQTLEFDPKDHPDHKKVQEEEKGAGMGNGAKALEVSNKLAKVLQNEIKEGKVKILTKNQRVIIRILDQGSFASGDSSLHPTFFPVLDKVAYMLNEIPGLITISGHTDDRPISNSVYRSNWELSAARAISVAHHLYERGVDKDRIVVTGNAATQPLVDNDTEEHRSRNRRVEISLTQDDEPRVQEAPEVVPSYLRNQIQQPPREIVVNQPANVKANAQQKNQSPQQKESANQKQSKTEQTKPAKKE
ncbi:MAG: OmpA family protein [Proteobacteria bacterium]|nr:OmpA family protein [Pseudomonadota bacterium]